MTRKDYIKLAAALAWTRPVMGKASQFKPRERQHRMLAWRMVVREIARQLKLHNNNFQFSRFFRACGYEEDVTYHLEVTT